jgi:hypothetical protein
MNEKADTTECTHDYVLTVLTFVRNVVWMLLVLALGFVPGIFIFCAQP